MKKILLLAAAAIFTISITQAQIKPDAERIRANTKVKQAPSKTPAPAPAPVSKTTATTSAEPLVYTLSAVRVKIKTGSDNKEFPSKVFALVKPRNQAAGAAAAFVQLKLDNEMRINTETEFGLERSQYNGEAGLNAFLAGGLTLRISYLPNFFADAWKIEGISMVIEFKDQHGNLHPTFGSKTITFTNANGFLNNEYREMECVTDASFTPITANIFK